MLFANQPVVACMAVYMAYVFGVAYLMLATFSDLWTDVYNEPLGISSLNYMFIAFGSFTGLFLNLKLINRICRALKAPTTISVSPSSACLL
ncbi:hypothetical protein BDW66DRAFT_135331 [Aspergillus desertorum]